MITVAARRTPAATERLGATVGARRSSQATSCCSPASSWRWSKTTVHPWGSSVRLGGGESVLTSPTFTLCQEYPTTPPVVHVDCWRLDTTAEIVDLGLDEMLDDGGVRRRRVGRSVRRTGHRRRRAAVARAPPTTATAHGDGRRTTISRDRPPFGPPASAHRSRAERRSRSRAGEPSPRHRHRHGGSLGRARARRGRGRQSFFQSSRCPTSADRRSSIPRSLPCLGDAGVAPSATSTAVVVDVGPGRVHRGTGRGRARRRACPRVRCRRDRARSQGSRAPRSSSRAVRAA